MKLEEQLELNMGEKKVRSSFTTLFSEPARKLRRVCERVLKIDPNLERLEAVVKKLEKVSAEVSTFLHLIENAKQEQQELEHQLYRDRESGCLPKNDLIGRGEEKDFVMQWLRKPTKEDPNHTLYKNISLLFIVGHGGMGKTTLFQHIYESVKEEFELNMWVCVSNDFDAKKVIADMLECLNKERPRLESLAVVQENLKAVVQSKRFLLVLDDIWEEDMSKWENVLCPLVYGGLGSKILLTTRMDTAASAIVNVISKDKEIYPLKGLEEDVCLKLLNTHAFAGVENLGAHKKLKDIASSIVKKLSGSPLAAKVIGGVLNSNLTERFWMKILESNVLNVEPKPGRNNILSILSLSFTLLPQSLQNCFAFCGLFPQDHEFDKDDLVRMWIALGFIQESYNEGETLEDIGGRYFDVFIRKSFFDEFQYRERIYYKMHDLLHDLARSISSEECFEFVGDDFLSFKVPKNVRHLFVKTENPEVLRMIKDVKNLHSLFLTTDDQAFTEILTEIFEASKRIRLLFIHSPWQEKMSEAIKNLKHLRYLSLTARLTHMPRSLSSLYHLRFIIYNKLLGSCSDDFLPGNASNLSNLRYLELPPNVFSRVPGIGKLRSLQELTEFNVKNENGYGIGELEHLSQLRKLKIHFMENVKDASEARSAKLFEKRKLTDLLLNWGNTEFGSLRKTVNSDLDVNVLENLEPYKNLKRLSIVSYEGSRSAKWMHNVDLISNLEYIHLDECSEWETLPPFGQLPHLKSLYLRNMPKAKRLDHKFHGNYKVSVVPLLEGLNIKGLQVLEDWFDGAGATAYDCFFPCLTELFLDNCPNLQELPHLPPKLKKMKIQKIGWKAALNWKQETNSCCGISKSIPPETLEVLSCPSITSLLSLGGLQQVESGIEKFQLILSEIVIDDPSLLPTVSIASFGKLTICNNEGLVSFTIEAEQWFSHVSSSLRELNFRDLKSLQSLPSSLERLSSVEILRIEKVPQLQQLLHIPASLTELCLEYLESLQCLPSSLSAISSLAYLKLDSIPLLKSLPVLPPSLSRLSINSLDNLQCLPSLSAISSLKHIHLVSISLLKSLPELPPSLSELHLYKLDNLQSLPFSLSAFSSLNHLYLNSIPLLKSLPELPPSLSELHLYKLDNLQSLPFSLSAFSSLNHLYLNSIPLLKSLPELPPSLNYLHINSLDNLECLPSSFSAISSLNRLYLYSIPLLESLPDLPSSLNSLSLRRLDKLQCLPSSLSAISSLNRIWLHNIPLLKSLPDLPSSLCSIRVTDCHPELMKRYNKESPIEGETLEDFGGRYFDVLVRKSFFDEFQQCERIHYKMHDLLHDLAQSISSKECFGFVGDDVLSFEVPKNVRHLLVKTENPEVLRMIKDVKNLRSLFLISERHSQCFTEILTEIFETSRRIRLLFIYSPWQRKISEAIKNLRHLRYLNLAARLTQMPRSLSSLYHLRFIIYKNVLGESCSDDFLPSNVSNLSNLRYVELPPNVFSSVPGIGKLRSLQELNEFNVKNENGYRIEELEHTRELRKLNIHFLENVKDAIEAGNAKLFEKRKLTVLYLNWGNIGNERKIVNSDLDVNVLENLKPYKNLKRLCIVSYKGVSPAEWMYNADLISNLEYISLNGCSEWETLPPLGQLPHLKSLDLCNMPKAKRLDHKFHGNDKVSVFPSLEVLSIIELQVLEDWFDGAAAYDCFFPCLRELYLHNCPNLQELPYLPPKLKEMSIRNIGWKAALNWKQETNNCCGISRLITLETLEVLSCPNMTSLLSLGGLQQVESGIEKFQLIVSEVVIDDPSLLPTVSIPSLEKLTICNNNVLVSFTIEAEQWFSRVSSSLRQLSFTGLKSLQSLPSSLKHLSSLEILRVKKVPQLQQLLHIPASLKELHLQYLDSLQCLPSSLSNISSLAHLKFQSIPLLKSLPDLPSSLSALDIICLDNLECLPSSLSDISSLRHLFLYSIPLLKSLPDLPSFLCLEVEDCHPELMERYEEY
ncbi:LOW QUALITY PROTEIN: putative disease resistance protein At3g14460 [Phalaenopsis equestris]|uniref:LOW QUALITY PROTEIN: putative disease resistance protein At3g14460 n=1 Tax=Phalaenopsis equestris TaxID=78828 RepID=UPI0009E5D814|nr:LOW QUALITY PROTEIN: putative disease resistance protein At3g14460 [Phalaenopsis equestris]